MVSGPGGLLPPQLTALSLAWENVPQSQEGSEKQGFCFRLAFASGVERNPKQSHLKNQIGCRRSIEAALEASALATVLHFLHQR